MGRREWDNHRLHIRRVKTDTHFYVPIYDHLRPLFERMNGARRGKRSPASPVFKIKDAKEALGQPVNALNSLLSASATCGSI